MPMSRWCHGGTLRSCCRRHSSSPMPSSRPSSRPSPVPTPVDPRSASSGPPGGSTSSASTPTTTSAMSCRPRSISRSGSPTCPTDDGRVELTRLDDGSRDGFTLGEDRPRAGTWLDYVAGTAWALAETGAPLRGLARRHRDVAAAERRAFVVGGHRAGVGLGDARRRRRAGRPADARPDLPARGERVRRRPERADGPVRRGLRRGRFRGPARLPVARVAAGRHPRRRPARRPPHGIAAASRRVRLQRPSCAVRGGGRGHRPRRPGRHVAPRRHPVPPRRGAGPGWTRSPIDAPSTSSARTQRVAEVVTALEAGDLASVGVAFAASHASLRDRFEVVSPELDAMVEIATSVPGVVAARMTGAGFGGCTVNLVRPDAVEALRDRRRARLSGPDRPDADGPAGRRRRRAPDASAETSRRHGGRGRVVH